MYQVSLLDSAGRRTVVDFHQLVLDDGTRAFDLQHRPDILFRKLSAMRVPEIAADMGSHQLMVALGRFRAATKIDQVTGRPAAEGDAA